MSRRFDHLGDVEAFVAVVEKGSITAGAIGLATTPSVISRAIARLEARLGVQLLRRTTRRLSLTEAGQLYLDQTRMAFALIGDAERAIQGQGGEVSGRVRLSVSTTYGNHRLPAQLRRFMQRYPLVEVEASIANRNVDLVAEGYDLAIRLGALPDSGLVARKLGDAPMGLVASPDYLARHPPLRTLDDLARHNCLPFVMPSTGRVAPWIFREGGRDVDWTPAGRLMVSDDVLGTVALADQGAGICQTYDFVVHERLQSGRLVWVLPHTRGRSRPCSVIYPPHRSLSAASRALIDLLAEDPIDAVL